MHWEKDFVMDVISVILIAGTLIGFCLIVGDEH